MPTKREPPACCNHVGGSNHNHPLHEKGPSWVNAVLHAPAAQVSLQLAIQSTLGNRVQYYGTRASKEPGGSEQCFGIRKDWLERLVISKVVEILDAPDLERWLREAIAKRLQANKKATGDVKALKQRVAALDKKIAKGVERLLLLGGDDLSDASALLDGWRDERRVYWTEDVDRRKLAAQRWRRAYYCHGPQFIRRAKRRGRFRRFPCDIRATHRATLRSCRW